MTDSDRFPSCFFYPVCFLFINNSVNNPVLVRFAFQSIFCRVKNNAVTVFSDMIKTDQHKSATVPKILVLWQDTL